MSVSLFVWHPAVLTIMISLAATNIISHDKRFVATNMCCHDKHMFVMTKHIFCCNISMFTVTKHLLQQNYVCCDKIFLSQQKTSVPLLRQKRHVLLWHTCVCHDQEFVATKLCFLRQIFVTTKVLSWQKYVCHDKSFVMTSKVLLQQKTCFVRTNKCLCHNKHVFVTTKLLSWQVLLRQKWYLWQLLPVILYSQAGPWGAQIQS